jgi:hypothetical protein
MVHALLGRCWTSARLQQDSLMNRGPCVLCSQMDEAIHHLLLGFVYNRKVRYRLLCFAGFQFLTPAWTTGGWQAVSGFTRAKKGLRHPGRASHLVNLEGVFPLVGFHSVAVAFPGSVPPAVWNMVLQALLCFDFGTVL